MSRMVRKQIYIEEEQDAVLKEVAEEYGISQAELIRQALEREIVGRRRVRVRYPDAMRKKAFEELKRFSESRKALKTEASAGEGRGWTRAEIYEEREGRYDRKTGE